jgi:predicted Zn finger-like uncharacterized protein
MQTRCPECGSFFRVTPEQLRTADGQARCGHCSSQFNALQNLIGHHADKPGETESAQSPDPEQSLPSDDAMAEPAENRESQTSATAVDKLPANESVDFDHLSRQLSDYFVDSPESPEPFISNDGTFDGDSSRSGEDPVVTEFEDCDISHATRPTVTVDAENTISDFADSLPGPAEVPEPMDSSDENATGDDQDWLSRFLDEPGEDGKPVYIVDGGTTAAGDRGTETSPANKAASPEHFDFDPRNSGSAIPTADAAVGADAASSYPSGTDAAEQSVMTPWYALPASADSATKHDPALLRFWIVTSLALTAALAIQLLHHNRDVLAAHDRYGGAVRTVYSWLNASLYPEWDLGAYEMRGSEAVSGESSPGVLDIRGQIAIKGPAAVGTPLLRVVLRDRWANIIATGIFSASEYRADVTDTMDLMQPGSLVPVRVSVADPGAEAQGYELEICLMTRNAGLICQS